MQVYTDYMGLLWVIVKSFYDGTVEAYRSDENGVILHNYPTRMRETDLNKILN